MMLCPTQASIFGAPGIHALNGSQRMHKPACCLSNVLPAVLNPRLCHGSHARSERVSVDWSNSRVGSLHLITVVKGKQDSRDSLASLASPIFASRGLTDAITSVHI